MRELADSPWTESRCERGNIWGNLGHPTGVRHLIGLALYLDCDRLVLGLDADHDGFGFLVGGVAPEMRRVRRRVNRPPRPDDPGADAIDLKSLFALDDVGDLMAFGMHMQRQPETGLPGRCEQQHF